MDFFESQHKARRRTGRLLALYLIAVAMMIASIYFVVLFLADLAGMPFERAHPMWHPEVFVGVAGLTLVLITLGALYRIVHLRSGGGAVARMLGGRLLEPSTRDPAERQLLNLVEEMAIASGVPVPETYVLENEKGINAFAAGYSPSDAAVAVTKSCMEQLSRDELQGVIAHEFAHILNGDMRLNIRLIGVLNGILLLHLIGYMIVRSLRYAHVGRSRRQGKEGGAIFLIIALGFALMVIGYVGVLFARIIQAAVSRQREYLADASAVQFTRNPGGISGALKKIGGSSFGGRIEASHAMEASHLFFANGIVSSLSNVFSTHPPLVKRIRAIEPSFDGKSWIVPRPRSPQPKPPPTRKAQPPPFPGAGAGALRPEVLLATIGTLDAQKISRAEAILARIPPKLREGVRDPGGAEAVVYALLLAPDAALRPRQLEIIRQHSLDAVAREVTARYEETKNLPPETRLPLVDLAIPALRRLSPIQFQHFREAVEALIAGDSQVSLFEFALEKVLVRHLDHVFREEARPTTQIYAAAGVAAEFSILLSALARVGSKDTMRAFAAAQSRLPDIAHTLRLSPEKDYTIVEIGRALDRLQLASFPVKKQLLDAAIATIISDGKIAPDEAELLRAVADTLDCPMPPLG